MSTTEIILFIIASISLVVSVLALLKLHKTTRANNLQGLTPNQVSATLIKTLQQSESVPSQASTTLAKTLEQQSTKIDELEKQISLYKRPTTGVVLKWANPREDKSAYLLTLFNDFPESIHNITIEVDSIYQTCTGIHCQEERCDFQKSINIFFLPAIFGENNTEPTIFRDEFIKIWLENKLKPIEIIVKYTRGPTISDNYETAKIYFTRDNLTKHLKIAIQSAKTRLTIVQSPTRKP